MFWREDSQRLTEMQSVRANALQFPIQCGPPQKQRNSQDQGPMTWRNQSTILHVGERTIGHLMWVRRQGRRRRVIMTMHLRDIARNWLSPNTVPLDLVSAPTSFPSQDASTRQKLWYSVKGCEPKTFPRRRNVLNLALTVASFLNVLTK